MATNNSINTGRLATAGEAVTGTDQVKLISPATLRSIVDNRVSENLGMKQSGSSLVLCAENGTDLSVSNRAKVRIKSPSSSGLFLNFELTANVTLPIGTYQGNDFNTRANVAWDEDIPFYIYALVTPTGPNITFGYSTCPSLRICPSTFLGTTATQAADSSYGLWMLNTNTGLFIGNPVQLLGSFRARKSNTNIWTVQTLDQEDGIGQYQENRVFNMPLGIWMPNAYTVQTGSATFANNQFTYTMNRYGLVTCSYCCTGDGGTAGSGTTNITLFLPSQMDWTKTGTTNRRGGDGTIFSSSTGRINTTYNPSDTQRTEIYRSDTGGFAVSNIFGAGAREFCGTLYYTMSLA